MSKRESNTPKGQKANFYQLKKRMVEYYTSTPEYYQSLRENVNPEDGIKALVDFVIGNKFRKIIDAGCGDGALCTLLEKKLQMCGYNVEYIKGFDISPHAVDMAQNFDLCGQNSLRFSGEI